jgi:tellurite resistance protein TerC
MILKTVEQVRRIFRVVAGFTLLAAGVVMLITPGPGWVAILLGLGLLAAEFVWARRLMDRIKREGNRIKVTVLGKPEPPKPDDPPRPPAEGPAPGEQIPS